MKLSSREFPHLVQNHENCGVCTCSICLSKEPTEYVSKQFNEEPQEAHKKSTGLILRLSSPSIQGFSQDFRIGCPKIRIWGELGVPILFHPIALYTKNMNFRVSKISNRVSKDTQTPLWLKP